MDEFFELITLIQTKKIPRVPIILAGKVYWDQVDKFIREKLFKELNAIDEEDVNLYKIVDSNDEIIDIIRNAPLRRE